MEQQEQLGVVETTAAVPVAVPAALAAAAAAPAAPTAARAQPVTRLPAKPVPTGGLVAAAASPLKLSADVLNDTHGVGDFFATINWVKSVAQTASMCMAAMAAVVRLGLCFIGIAALLHGSVAFNETRGAAADAPSPAPARLLMTFVRTWLVMALAEQYTHMFKTATKNAAVDVVISVAFAISGCVLALYVHDAQWVACTNDQPQPLRAYALFAHAAVRMLHVLAWGVSQLLLSWMKHKMPALSALGNTLRAVTNT